MAPRGAGLNAGGGGRRVVGQLQIHLCIHVCLEVLERDGLLFLFKIRRSLGVGGGRGSCERSAGPAGRSGIKVCKRPSSACGFVDATWPSGEEGSGLGTGVVASPHRDARALWSCRTGWLGESWGIPVAGRTCLWLSRRAWRPAEPFLPPRDGGCTGQMPISLRPGAATPLASRSLQGVDVGQALGSDPSPQTGAAPGLPALPSCTSTLLSLPCFASLRTSLSHLLTLRVACLDEHCQPRAAPASLRREGDSCQVSSGHHRLLPRPSPPWR